LNRDEEDHMAVPPATTTFRQKVTFSFWPLLSLGIWQLDLN
jgi:hypothetical protein